MMPQRQIPVLSLIVTTLLVTGCATNYQPSDYAGGYEHERLAENRYIVSFRGNGFTSSARSRDFAMLRAAEIGLQLGYAYFVVDTADDRGGTDRTPSGSIYKPGIDLHVRYFDVVPDGRHLDIYPTEQLASQLRNRYKLE